jgi:hypothetical protein
MTYEAPNGAGRGYVENRGVMATIGTLVGRAGIAFMVGVVTSGSPLSPVCNT